MEGLLQSHDGEKYFLSLQIIGNLAKKDIRGSETLITEFHALVRKGSSQSEEETCKTGQGGNVSRRRSNAVRAPHRPAKGAGVMRAAPVGQAQHQG